SSISYNDGATATVGYGLDRRGRQTTNTQGSITTTRVFDEPGNLLSEAYTGGPLGGLSLTNAYDQYLRRTNLALFSSLPALLSSATNTYDAASRLATVGDGQGNSANYGYLANSP